MKHVEQGYGYCCCDPRDFVPDLEVCTPEEVRRHADDCAALNRDEDIVDKNGCPRFTLEGYGHGSYSFEWDCEGADDCPECEPPSPPTEPEEPR